MAIDWDGMIKTVMAELSGKMPADVGMFDLGGRVLFPVYGSDGGIQATVAAWLIKKGDGGPTRLEGGGNLPRVKTTDPDGWTYLPIMFSATEVDPQEFSAKILKAAQELSPVPIDERGPVKPEIRKMHAQAKLRIRRIDKCPQGHQWIVEGAPDGMVSNHITQETCFCGYQFSYRGALIGAIAE